MNRKQDRSGMLLARHRKLVLLLADVFLISVCYLVTWLMINGRISMMEYLPTMIYSWGMYIVIFVVVFWIMGMYESLWRFAEAYEYSKCMLATVIAAIIFAGLTLLVLRPPLVEIRVPFSIYFLSAMFAGMSTLILRMFYRAYRNTMWRRKSRVSARKVLLVGAGETGNAVLLDISRQADSKFSVVCVVDDDPDKIGRTIQGIRVSGGTQDIPRYVERHGVDMIIIAIPHATKEELQKITSICAGTKCQLKKVPNLYTFVSDNASILASIRDVSVEDLLGRDVIEIRESENAPLTDRRVLVTGAGGSIGSELCRQIIAQGPEKLVLVDISENGLYDIQQELIRTYGNKCAIAVEVASVRDEARIDKLFSTYRPEYIYHAAAHKHVPLMETAPEEAVKNNIFGTLNVVRAADRYGVKRFVMISTDKAVNPTNVMGATKRVCEMIVQCAGHDSSTEYVAVRFGNVLGSNGSVIPLFQDQISEGGPVTVTHPDIIRFFMTISEAVSLVLVAGEMARGGEIFVLDMGEPVKILNLAENLIRMSGYEPYKDVEIEFTGLRPGEKLYEELLMDEEGLQKTENSKIFVGYEADIDAARLYTTLERMRPMAARGDVEGLLGCLHSLVAGFHDREVVLPSIETDQ